MWRENLPRPGKCTRRDPTPLKDDMNSKQRRRLRRQKLPGLINLLATKRITGELDPWINTAVLIAAAAKNPHRIDKVMPLIERGDYYDRHDLEQHTYGTYQSPKAIRLPRDPGKSVIYGRPIQQILVDEMAWAAPKDETYDDLLDAIKYGSTQTFCAPEILSHARQDDAGGV